MYQSIECTGTAMGFYYLINISFFFVLNWNNCNLGAEDSLYECTPIAVAAAGVCDGGEKGYQIC